MTLARFWSKTAVDGKCIVWIGATKRRGLPYGRYSADGRAQHAHRFIYEHGFTTREIGSLFDISHGRVSDITNGKAY